MIMLMLSSRISFKMRIPGITCSILIACCIYLIQGFSLNAYPVIDVREYGAPTHINGIESVLIAKGDDPLFANPDYDDSAWRHTSLPSDWADIFPDYNGICWYRIHFALPDTLPHESIGISLGTIVDSDETFVNGKKIGSSGVVDGTDSAYDKLRIYELPAAYLVPGKDNVLAIRIRGLFSYMNGPYAGELKLDSLSKLYSDFFLREIADYAFVVVYLVVALYFFLFFASRRKDLENLTFAFFCLFISAYFLLRTQLKHVLGLPFFEMKKLEYLLLETLVAIMLEFLILYFRKRHSILHYVYFGITAVFFSIVLFTNDFVFWDTFNERVMVPSWIVGAGLCFVILGSKFKSEPDARKILISLIILFLTLVNDVLVNMNIYSFPWLSRYGFFFFIGGIATSLSRKFVRLHDEVEDLNKNLEMKVAQRTRELNNTVRALEDAKMETDNILQNVREGIFLLDEELRIGHNYSKSLAFIFEGRELGGVLFGELIEPLVPEQEAVKAQDFLHLALTHPIPEARLAKLNPLEDIPVYFKKDDAALVKHLSFAFKRIRGNDSKRYILATVRDLTDTRFLEQKIRETEERAGKETELLLSIIHVNPALVTGFIRETWTELFRIVDMLEASQFSKDLKSLVRDVFTSIHAVKGNALMLGIRPFAERTHEIEEQLVELFGKPSVEAIDLFPVPYGISKLIDILSDIQNLINTIRGYREAMETEVGFGDEYLIEAFNSLVLRVSGREGKKVEIDLSGFTIPDSARIIEYPLKKALLQIVKNAVTHGIETPQERIRIGKSETGLIEVSSKISASEIEVSVRDDGRGIKVDEIERIARERGLLKSNESESIRREEVVSLISAQGSRPRTNRPSIRDEVSGSMSSRTRSEISVEPYPWISRSINTHALPYAYRWRKNMRRKDTGSIIEAVR
jgi:signal transduction histidine kinase